MGLTRENEFQSLEKCANTGIIASSVSFKPVLASFSCGVQNLFVTFGVVSNDFFLEDI